MKKNIKAMSSMMLAVLLSIGTVACSGGGVDSSSNNNKNNGSALDGGKIEADATQHSVTVASLEDYSEDRECWLTIPDSELVINPFDYESDANFASDRRQTEYFDRENLTIDLGILDYKSTGQKIQNILGCAAINPYGGHLYAKEGYKIGWRPDRLLYDVEYDSGLTLEGYDYFYDANTIVRNITVNEKAVVLWGGFAAGGPNFLRLQDGAFVYRRADGVTVAIATSCSGSWGFYNSETDFVEGAEVSDTPEQTGVWCYTPEQTELVSVSIATGGFGEKTEDVVARAKKPFTQNNFVKIAAEREKQWNEWMSACPLPETYEFNGDFDTKDVTANEVRSYYYRSWAQIISNVLPSNPNFAYRSISVGKPSMWSEGDSKMKYSAVWESLYGTQMYAFIDPDIAWELCLGTMSIIPEDGNLLGESLPSNKAHTVWICYTAKEDKAKLQECIEPLTNYLNWRFENPRWILSGAHDILDERDIDFAAAYLVDLRFMIKICNELGMTTEAAYWEGKATTMYANMCEWFFKTETPVQYYYLNSGNTSAGTPLWITKSLWDNELQGAELQKVLNFAVAQYDVDKAFAGFGGVKYDDWAFTLYGFVKNGRADIAADMVQALLRDIPRSGFVGELYNANWRGTVCEGVRPSMFGAILTIDNVWLRNGFMYHEGGIGAINLFEGEGGVSGISLNGVEYAIHMNGTTDKYSITKNGQKTDYDIANGSYVDPIE